jgi:hypothetical protein
LSVVTSDLAVPTWLAVAIVLALVVLAVAALRLARSVRQARSQTEALLAAAAHDADALREQLAGIEAELAAQQAVAQRRDRTPVTVVDDREYVITDLGDDRGPRVPARVVPAPVFTDILIRESVIKTAALAAGLRRALSAEARNRIRFEMKREVKRSRKQRRSDLRQARREFEARQRAGIELTG